MHNENSFDALSCKSRLKLNVFEMRWKVWGDILNNSTADSILYININSLSPSLRAHI